MASCAGTTTPTCAPISLRRSTTQTDHPTNPVSSRRRSAPSRSTRSPSRLRRSSSLCPSPTSYTQNSSTPPSRGTSTLSAWSSSKRSSRALSKGVGGAPTRRSFTSPYSPSAAAIVRPPLSISPPSSARRSPAVADSSQRLAVSVVPPELCSPPHDPSTRGEPFADAALQLLSSEIAAPTFSTIRGLMSLAIYFAGVAKPHQGWVSRRTCSFTSCPTGYGSATDSFHVLCCKSTPDSPTASATTVRPRPARPRRDRTGSDSFPPCAVGLHLDASFAEGVNHDLRLQRRQLL